MYIEFLHEIQNNFHMRLEIFIDCQLSSVIELFAAHFYRQKMFAKLIKSLLECFTFRRNIIIGFKYKHLSTTFVSECVGFFYKFIE